MRTKNKKLLLLFFTIMFVASFFFSLGSGAVKLSYIDIIQAIFDKEDKVFYQVIWNVRLPRTIVAGLAGISLALSGAILQGIMGNPLASPGVIGVTSGAGLVAIIILILFPEHYYVVPAGAFFGALIATLIIYVLAWKDGVIPTSLVLAGVAVSRILNAGINTLLTFYPDRVAGVIGFMVGGLSAVTWTHVKMIFPYAIVGSIILLFMSPKLNILVLGDDVATGLGVDVEKVRFVFIILSSILAGSAVSAVGLLGFVGLMVPHITRLIIGSDYRYLFPGSILLGASIVMICDTLARVLFAPREIAVGIIMSAIGGPFFLYLLKERMR